MRGQTEPLQALDEIEVQVEFPPAMLHGSAGWVVMVIVVPAFSTRDDGDKPVVAALFTRFVRAVSEGMA